MSLLKSKVARALVVALLLLLGQMPSVLAGEPVNITVSTEPQVELGDTATVRVKVSDWAGRPVAKAAVVLSSPAAFGGATGDMRLGQVTTDSRGEATFPFRVTREGPQTVIARFAGNDSYQAAEESTSLTAEGTAQLYQQQAGVQVPGVGVWLLVLVLGIFWTVYLTVMTLVTLIAQEGEAGEPIPGVRYG